MPHSDDYIKGKQGWSLVPDAGIYYYDPGPIVFHGNVVLGGRLTVVEEDI